MTDWSKVSAHSENWDMFASHAETGLSVIGRKNVTDESSVTYTAKNGDTFKRVEISLQVYSGFVSVSRDLKAEYRTDEKSEWKSLVMAEEGEENIIGKETLAFKLQKIYCELPAETAEIKISLLNDVGWTLFIDSVTLDIKKGRISSAIAEEPSFCTYFFDIIYSTSSGSMLRICSSIFMSSYFWLYSARYVLYSLLSEGYTLEL